MILTRRAFIPLAASCVMAMTLVAQTAKVQPLTDSESIRAKHIYEESKRIEAEKSAFDAEIGQKYAGKGLYLFEYSEDFKYIVPKTSPTCSGYCWPSSQWLNCPGNVACFTASPANLSVINPVSLKDQTKW